MQLCFTVHITLCYTKKPIFFSKIVVYLNMSKINQRGSDSRSLNQLRLLSHGKPDFLLASGGSIFQWPWCLQRPQSKVVLSLSYILTFWVDMFKILCYSKFHIAIKNYICLVSWHILSIYSSCVAESTHLLTSTSTFLSSSQLKIDILNYRASSLAFKNSSCN